MVRLKLVWLLWLLIAQWLTHVKHCFTIWGKGRSAEMWGSALSPRPRLCPVFWDVTAGITSGPGEAQSAGSGCLRALRTRGLPPEASVPAASGCGHCVGRGGEKEHACRSSEPPPCSQPLSWHRAHREVSAGSADGRRLAPWAAHTGLCVEIQVQKESLHWASQIIREEHLR